MSAAGRVSLFHILPVFLVVFFNLYSFPLSITLGVDVLVCLFVLFSTSVITYGNKYIRNIIICAFFLGLYTVIVCFVNGSDSIYTIGKPLRFVFTLIVFAFLSTRFAKYSNKEIIIALVLALIIHLAFVYTEFFIPILKPVLFSYLDSEKEDILNFPLRAFGLCSSFDGAGLILCVFQALLWLLSLKEKSAFIFFLCLISFVGCFLVSRTSMLISTIFMVLIIFSFAKRNKKLLFLYIIPVFIIGGYYVYGLASDILSTSIIEESYRTESAEKLTGEMLYLPDSFLGVLFGTGDRTDDSDIGYINQIFMVGIVGMLWILSLYYQTFVAIRKMRVQFKYESWFLIIILVLLLVYNYKLSFLYSRSVSDVYFLLVFIMIRKIRRVKVDSPIISVVNE